MAHFVEVGDLSDRGKKPGGLRVTGNNKNDHEQDDTQQAGKPESGRMTRNIHFLAGKDSVSFLLTQFAPRAHRKVSEGEGANSLA